MANGNFNATELTDLQTRATTTFTTILENISAIKGACGEMSGIVLSEDSSLGSRWDSVSTNMARPVETIEDTFTVVRALLDKYVSDTIENERAAQAELEGIDEGISNLDTMATTLFDGLSALAGIGIGGTAISIPGLFDGDGEGPGGEVVTLPAPDVTVKYAPPEIDVHIEPIPDVTVKYAPPQPDIHVDPVPDVTVKYAPPQPDIHVDPVPDVTVKYAPPQPDIHIEPLPVMKYAPPEYMGVSEGNFETKNAK